MLSQVIYDEAVASRKLEYPRMSSKNVCYASVIRYFEFEVIAGSFTKTKNIKRLTGKKMELKH